MSNVVRLPVVTSIDMDPDVILGEASGKLSEVVIIGTTTDGDEYFAASQAGGPDALWHLEPARHKLMTMTDDMTGAA